MLTKKQRERITQACTILREAERPVRVLRSIGWPSAASAEFFAKGAKEMPKVSYTPIDATPIIEAVEKARRLADGTSPIHAWLNRIADMVSAGARLVATVGTKDFHDHSVEIYKSPAVAMLDGETQPFELARQLDETLAAFSEDGGGEFLVPGPESMMSADQLGARMTPILDRFFGDHAPEIEIVDNLSANALAGSRYIRLRKQAKFSDKDLQQLVQHEAFIHVGTSLNGREQTALPILGAGHPGTTRTQEGLAVFAEMISGAMDPARLRRLANRVIAIQMSMDGADFLDLYRFFLEHGNEPGQAFESARRVVRGGLVTGGAPFTKDVVYLEGLLMVHNFLRATVQFGRLDCLHLLFCGKLDIEDLPALVMLAENGMCQFPRFLPPWAADAGYLISYLTYSSFLNRVNLDRVRQHYAKVLSDVPKLTLPE